ncbi:uncharacterized protein TrAtP1_003149 [Trichoderma atroviride]|uniref:uncharacterized protein n=1 Tax=Hypocrea atroviridis TaxID=63577 RepID=UPI00331692EB|nr:hypothetical protein TrAtP1_003149 [Trichoderma atroviride]
MSLDEGGLGKFADQILVRVPAAAATQPSYKHVETKCSRLYILGLASLPTHSITITRASQPRSNLSGQASRRRRDAQEQALNCGPGGNPGDGADGRRSNTCIRLRGQTPPAGDPPSAGPISGCQPRPRPCNPSFSNHGYALLGLIERLLQQGEWD